MTKLLQSTFSSIQLLLNPALVATHILEKVFSKKEYSIVLPEWVVIELAYRLVEAARNDPQAKNAALIDQFNQMATRTADQVKQLYRREFNSESDVDALKNSDAYHVLRYWNLIPDLPNHRNPKLH
jgi:hypothetical protein